MAWAKKITTSFHTLSLLARKARERVLPERDETDTVVALDVGSSRVACAIAEVRGGKPVVLAAETVPAYGIRCGEIVDLERAGESIRIAVQSVGERAGADVRSVVVGFSGDVRLSLAKGTLELGEHSRAVSEADVARLRKSLWPDAGPGRKVVHRFDGPCAVGELYGIERPIGLMGRTLSASAAFLSAPTERVENLLRAVRGAGIEIENLVLEPWSSALGALTEDERALGVAVLDIGAGGFRGVLFEGGRLRQTCAFGQERHTPQFGIPAAAGGLDGVVMGLARHFRVTSASARLLMEKHGQVGTAPPGLECIEVAGVEGQGLQRITRNEWSSTLEELLTPAVRSLRDGLSAFTPGHAGGVVLVGQGARLGGLPALVSKHFGGVRVRCGFPHWTAAKGVTLPQELDGAGACALCGILSHGAAARVQWRTRLRTTWWGRLRLGLANARSSG